MPFTLLWNSPHMFPSLRITFTLLVSGDISSRRPPFHELKPPVCVVPPQPVSCQRAGTLSYFMVYSQCQARLRDARNVYRVRDLMKATGLKAKGSMTKNM